MRRLMWSWLGLLGLVGCGSESIDDRCETQRAKYEAFVASHRQCTVTSDCAVVGGCSDTFGFAAVSLSARRQAQLLSEAPMGCGQFDGPTYVASCVSGRCVTQSSGQYCGQPFDAGRDSGTVSGVDSGIDAGAAP